MVVAVKGMTQNSGCAEVGALCADSSINPALFCPGLSLLITETDIWQVSSKSRGMIRDIQDGFQLNL